MIAPQPIEQTPPPLERKGLDVDFAHYYNLLYRNIWLFLAVTAVVVIGTAAWVVRQPKIYASRAVVQVEQQEQKILNASDVQTDKMEAADYIGTVVQALTSNTLLVRVAKSAGLLKDKSLFPPKEDGKEYTDTEISGRLRGKVSASLRRGTRLIDITVEDTDPERARRIAESVVKEFLRQSFEQRMSLSRVANDFLGEEADKLKAKLEKSERKLQEYRKQHNAVSLENSQNIIVDKLKDISTRATDAKGQRIRLESDIEQLRSIPADDVDRMLQISSVSAIPQVEGIRSQLVTAESDLGAIQKTYLHKHPKYIQATTRTSQLKNSLKETLNNASRILDTQYKAALDTETKLDTALKEQERAALELDNIAIPYNLLQREVDSDRTMLDSVNARLRETSVAAGVEKSAFRIIEEPMVPSVSIKPKKMRVVLMALLIGMGLAAAIIFGLDMLDTSLRSVDQAETYLDLPALSVISDMSGIDQERIPNVFASSESQQSEAFRTLRTALSLLGPEPTRRIFLMTSAIPNEGKTFSSFNASMAFALEGHKTVLIDADLRRPSVHKIFPEAKAAKNRSGLADYLAGNAKLDEVIAPGPQQNLSIICSGGKAPNPGELLEATAFQQLMTELSARFDRIIIDTAPINAVSDSLRIAALADYVCLVVRAGKTPKKAVSRALNLIEQAGGKISGFVLNRASMGRGSSYYYYYYQYGEGDNRAEKSARS